MCSCLTDWIQNIIGWNGDNQIITTKHLNISTLLRKILSCIREASQAKWCLFLKLPNKTWNLFFFYFRLNICMFNTFNKQQAAEKQRKKWHVVIFVRLAYHHKLDGVPQMLKWNEENFSVVFRLYIKIIFYYIFLVCPWF